MTNLDHMKQEFLAVLSSVVGNSNGATIALHQPNLGQLEASTVAECLESGWVSSVGGFISKFEDQLAKFTGATHVIAVVNGTAALHLALHSIGVKPTDEVIIPTLSFVATANAVAHCGATPHFADSNSVNLGLDPGALRTHLSNISKIQDGKLINKQTGKRIAAIVPMHTFGHPMLIKQLEVVAAEFGLPIVEDAAESLGSFVDGQHTGTFGKCGILSFNGNKIVTTGGGGAIITNDDALATKIRHLATTAKLPHAYEYQHDFTAWNYRMPNINAALGFAQLSRLEQFLLAKRTLANKYSSAFNSSSFFEFVSEPKYTNSNYWLNTVRINEPSLETRNTLIAAAHSGGYLCRPAWNLLHTLPMYLQTPRADLDVACVLANSLINVPSSAYHCLSST